LTLLLRELASVRAMARAGYAIYKRCVPGDRRKVQAQSNDDSSRGGGARDIRFNPRDMFESVVEEVFTDSYVRDNGRKVNSAPVYWWEDEEVCGPLVVEFWSPTESRGGDIRLSRVHKVTPFDEDHIPAQALDPFFLIWSDDDGKVWARYATVEELSAPGWSQQFVQPILQSVSAVSASQNIRGWIDVRTGIGEHKDVR
jgi:hypothetical protein